MFTSILVATDGSEHAQKAVTIAGGLAAHYRATLILLYVIEPARLTPELRHMAEIEHLSESGPLAADLSDVRGRLTADLNQLKDSAAVAERVMQTLAERVLHQARRSAAAAGAAAIRTVTETGGPAECILACAEREDADLIVLGSRGLSDLKGLLLGSVSHKVSHLAPCTCMTVK